MPERLVHRRHQSRRRARLPSGKQSDFVTTANEFVAQVATTRSVPPYPAGGTDSNGGATWAMRIGILLQLL